MTTLAQAFNPQQPLGGNKHTLPAPEPAAYGLVLIGMCLVVVAAFKLLALRKSRTPRRS